MSTPQERQQALLEARVTQQIGAMALDLMKMQTEVEALRAQAEAANAEVARLAELNAALEAQVESLTAAPAEATTD